MAQDPAQPRRRFFREALEASVSALVVALLLKVFVVEAYRIPTGSMQPTLYGHTAGDGTAVKDTVLVDRLAYLRGDPRRFDVAVFRFPLDRGRSFVKRIWGLPGETLRIANGDVQRLEPDGAWLSLERPDEVRDAMWLELDHAAGWDLVHAKVKPERDAADERSAPLHVALAPPSGADARLTYPRGAGETSPDLGVVDLYRDGYPARLRSRLAESGGQHVVGDLRLELDVLVPTDDTSLDWLTLQLRERGEHGWQHTVARLRVRGRSQGEDAGGLAVFVEPDAPRPGAPRPGASKLPRRADHLRAWTTGFLEPGVRTRVVLEVCDDVARLSLEVDGRRDSTSAPLLAIEPLASSVHVTADGRVDLSVTLARDVHYVLGGRAATDTWAIPAGHYFMLGDNTQRSVDSREWRLVAYQFEAGPRAGDVVLGQSVPGENPLTALGEGAQPVWYFRDQWGERHRFPTEEVGMPPPIEAPFVPRDHLVGRVFVALWPLRAGLGRPTWIR
jgi:signal peptidase I